MHTDLVLYPEGFLLFTLNGADNPATPVQVELVEDELLLFVYPEVDCVVGYSDSFVPLIGQGSGTMQEEVIFLKSSIWYLIQWPSQYFTPALLSVPVSSANIYINKIRAQNSAGDIYNVLNR